MTSSGPPADRFREALGAYPTGVSVITATGEDGPSGATANSVTSLSIAPPMMLACLDRGSRTLASVRASGRFAVNCLAGDQAELARRFAGKDDEAVKWEGIDWKTAEGSPRIAGVVAFLACEVEQMIDGGDHLIVTGAVLSAHASPGAPLVFHRGDYHALG